MSDANEMLAEAKAALMRVQQFEPEKLIRREELGKHKFVTAVGPAEKLIDFFRNLEASQLDYFPERQLIDIRDVANTVFNIFDSIVHFEVEQAQPSVADAQSNLVKQLNDNYQFAFTTLSPLIAFAAAKAHDFTTLEREARASSQAAKDQAEAVLAELNDQKDAAERILQETRALAAEQGVSNQAIHFKKEADDHEKSAQLWLKRSVWTSIGLGAFAILSLGVHKIPYLVPTNSYEASQLIVSKFLIFAVIGYMLLLSARNFLSHRHNAVVNRHRQNALATFTALVEAGSEPGSSDIVLTHASACIFAPQETGYAKQEAAKLDAHPAMQLLPRIQQVSGPM